MKLKIGMKKLGSILKARVQSLCRRRRLLRQLGGGVSLRSSCWLSGGPIPAEGLSPLALLSLETRPIGIHSTLPGQSQIQPRFIRKNPHTETYERGKLPRPFLQFLFLLSSRRLKIMLHSDFVPFLRVLISFSLCFAIGHLHFCTLKLKLKAKGLRGYLMLIGR